MESNYIHNVKMQPFDDFGFYCQRAVKWQNGSVENPLEKSLLNMLVELDAAVKKMPTANPKPNLLSIFSRLDELTKQLPRETDSQLLHYLHKKSYEKARLFLEGRDAENQIGNCRHV
jgi:hypothetical protein